MMQSTYVTIGVFLLLSAAAVADNIDSSDQSTVDSVKLQGSCPADFSVKEGANSGFISDDHAREFYVFFPETLETPRPLLVALTGTVATELQFVSDQVSQFESLTDDGWIVVSPIRRCTTEGRTCTGVGPNGSNDGRFWEPWFDGPIVQGNDGGPDVRFIDAMVNCIASKYPVDKNRIYSGGSSAGATMTSRNMMFNSELFAGGIGASGNFQYLGQIPIQPLDPIAMDDSIIVLAWGGAEDRYGSSDYSVETKLASQYYARQANVVTVSCSGTHGHPWPKAFGPWAVKTVLSHPKGTSVEDFVLTSPPQGFSCVLGAYTDH